MRLWVAGSLALSFSELFVSAAVHMGYGLYIFSTAVVSDFCEIVFNRRSIRSRIWNDSLWEAVGDACNKPNILASDCSRDIGNGPFFQGHEVVPIVLVHGILGFGKGRLGSLSYWAGAEKRDDRVLVPDLGSLTSVYDSLCLSLGNWVFGTKSIFDFMHLVFANESVSGRESFYTTLKAEQLTMGKSTVPIMAMPNLARLMSKWKFTSSNGTGYYPEWDENHPVHFVGHSAGVQVVRVLQQMLAEKKFKGYENSTEDWVLSVTSLSGALNGTTRVYIDGMQPEDGKTMRPICLLKLCHLGVVIYDWLDIAWLKKYYNFGFDHFNLTWRQVGISGLVDGILGNIGPFASEDWILPDLSLQVSVELNSKLQTFPNTYYFSYATKKTRKLFGLTVPSSLFGIHPLLFIRTLQMCQWCYPSNVPPPNKGYNDEDWQDNDGALNTISMLYPRFPEPHPNCWFSPDFKDGQSLQQGIWYYTIVEADHILFIMNRERAGVHFDILYDSIFQRCRKQMQRGVSVPSANKALDNVCNCVENCVCQLSTFCHRQ
eukprot:Gb_32161 [translate_table: standard]